MKQAATRVDDRQYDIFRATAQSIGTTPSDALRMFIYAFNEHHGFPYEVTTSKPVEVEPLEDERCATNFATQLSMEAINAAW